MDKQLSNLIIYFSGHIHAYDEHIKVIYKEATALFKR